MPLLDVTPGYIRNDFLVNFKDYDISLQHFIDYSSIPALHWAGEPEKIAASELLQANIWPILTATQQFYSRYPLMPPNSHPNPNDSYQDNVFLLYSGNHYNMLAHKGQNRIPDFRFQLSDIPELAKHTFAIP
jgi:hypothetical protein